VKHQVRRRYREFGSQSTFGFDLRSTLNLSEPAADVLLMALYFRERSRSSFTTALTDLLSNRDLYLDHIEGNVELDSFMEVEMPDVLRLFTLYRNVKIVADATGLTWSIPSLVDFVRNDHATFKDKYCLLHECTQDEMLRALAPLFLATIEQGCRLVETLERDYWEEQEFLLTRYVTEYGATSWVDGARARLKWLLPRTGGETG
jgi:hypothetical protein